MVTGDFSLQRQCQTCLKTFPNHVALCSHLEVYRVGERALTKEIEKCRTHTAKAYDLNKLCERCQVHATLAVDTHDSNNESDDNSKIDENNSTSRINENRRPATRGLRNCPDAGCGKQFKTRKELLRHFELHVDCNEVCVECFRRFTHVSALIKHAQTHNYSSDRKRSFMLGLCDDLHNKAILEMDQMMEVLNNSTITPNSETMKRNFEGTSLDQDLTSSKKVKLRHHDEQRLLGTMSGTTTHVELEGPSFPSECLDMHPMVDEDVFAPLLFHGCPQQAANNFDPPFFLEPPLVLHNAPPELDGIRMCDDMTGPFFESTPHLRGNLNQWDWEDGA